jgi:hypothetical protein
MSDLGPLGQCARERDTLAHAARQLVRTLVPESLEVDELQERLGLGATLGLGHAVEPEGQLDVLGRGQPREQGGLLEHDRRAAGVELDAAGTRPIETGDEVEKRRLAAPRGADHAQELTPVDGQRDALERQHAVAGRAVVLGHAVDLDGRIDGPKPVGRSVIRRPKRRHGAGISGLPASLRASFRSVRS